MQHATWCLVMHALQHEELRMPLCGHENSGYVECQHSFMVVRGSGQATRRAVEAIVSWAFA
jgi:hypothetical protein